MILVGLLCTALLTSFWMYLILADLSDLPPEYELDEIVESQKITMKDLGNIRDGDQTKFIFDEVDEIG